MRDSEVPCTCTCCLSASFPFPMGTLCYSFPICLSFFELFVLSLTRPVLVPETKEVVSHKYKTPMVSQLWCLWWFSRGYIFKFSCGEKSYIETAGFMVKHQLLFMMFSLGGDNKTQWLFYLWNERNSFHSAESTVSFFKTDKDVR